MVLTGDVGVWWMACHLWHDNNSIYRNCSSYNVHSPVCLPRKIVFVLNSETKSILWPIVSVHWSKWEQQVSKCAQQAPWGTANAILEQNDTSWSLCMQYVWCVCDTSRSSEPNYDYQEKLGWMCGLLKAYLKKRYTHCTAHACLLSLFCQTSWIYSSPADIARSAYICGNFSHVPCLLLAAPASLKLCFQEAEYILHARVSHAYCIWCLNGLGFKKEEQEDLY